MVSESTSVNCARPIFGLDRKEQRNPPLLDLRGASEVGLGLAPIGICPVRQAQIAKRPRDGAIVRARGRSLGLRALLRTGISLSRDDPAPGTPRRGRRAEAGDHEVLGTEIFLSDRQRALEERLGAREITQFPVDLAPRMAWWCLATLRCSGPRVFTRIASARS